MTLSGVAATIIYQNDDFVSVCVSVGSPGIGHVGLVDVTGALTFKGKWMGL